MTIQEYFGTLQQSFVEVWKNHLETSKYSDHKALNDYYDDIVDAMDQTIEDYQGIYGKLGNLKNTIETEIDDPIKYLNKLKKFLKDGREELIKKDDTEIWSDLDNVLSIIDSTLYKLKELSESEKVIEKSLKDFLTESMNASQDWNDKEGIEARNEMVNFFKNCDPERVVDMLWVCFDKRTMKDFYYFLKRNHEI